MTFGQRIRRARRALDMTQAELSDLVGVARSTVAQYEAGTRQPDMGLLVSLCDVLGVTADWLLTGVWESHDLRQDVTKGVEPARFGMFRLFRWQH